VLAGGVFYPRSVKAWEEDVQPEYQQSQELMRRIIEIQPQRLHYQIKQDQDGEVDFGDAVNTLGILFEIPPSKYTLSVRKPVSRGGKKSRTATMAIKEVGIVKSARFISAMLSLSPDLKCETISLDKAKTGKDNWNVDLTMTYQY
jgi:hypothetical protein